MGIEIETYLRDASGTGVRLAEVDRYEGEVRHVEGYISFTIDGQPVLSEELWDDVDWLWPYVVQSVDDCLSKGTGERSFPDQPILFRVERVGSERLLFKVQGGRFNRTVSADRAEALSEIETGALNFFMELDRLIPGSSSGYESIRALMREWH